MTCLPTITAMRSMTTSPWAPAAKTRKGSSSNISEGLPYGEKELDVPQVLLRALAKAGKLGRRQTRIALQQLIRRSAESEKGRRIHAVREIDADRPKRSAVSEADAGRMHHIIEVIQVALAEAEVDIAERAEHVAHVVKEHALNILADEGKA